MSCPSGGVSVAGGTSSGSYEAVLAGKLDDALRHEAKLRAVQTALATGTSPAALKAAMAARGIGERWLVPPRHALTDEQAAQVSARLTGLGIL
jgi:dihydrodipicolinate synthase/N-acetylneuraminate lyase